MPFLLSEKPCEVTFTDKIANCSITLFYKLPTTEERTAYSSELVVRKKRKVESKIGPTRLKYGLKVLTGFKEGDFATDRGPISSDSGSSRYDANWKALVTKYASHLVMALGAHVFESADEEEPDDAEPGGTEDGEGVIADDNPLSGISGS